MSKPSRQKAKAANTRQKLLDAAAEVVRTEGAANLTLDRVAATASVSKGGLLYHYGTKKALLAALLDNTLSTANEELETLAAASGRDRGAFATAYLEFVRQRNHDAGAATGVFAAAALDEGDLTSAREQFAAWQQRLLTDDDLDETAALVARVVGDGLWLIDLFDLAPPDERQRGLVLDHVLELIAT